MEHKQKRMAELVLKQLTGDISEEEFKELHLIRTDLKINDQLFDELLNPAYLAARFEVMNKFDEKASWEKVKKAIAPKLHKLIPMESFQRAAILVAITVATWLFLSTPRPGASNSIAMVKKLEMQKIVDLIYPKEGYKVEYEWGTKPRQYVVIGYSAPSDQLKQLLRQYDYNLTIKRNNIIVNF